MLTDQTKDQKGKRKRNSSSICSGMQTKEANPR